MNEEEQSKTKRVSFYSNTVSISFSSFKIQGICHGTVGGIVGYVCKLWPAELNLDAASFKYIKKKSYVISMA